MKKLLFLVVFLTPALNGFTQQSYLSLDSLESLTRSKLTGYLTDQAWRKDDQRFFSDWQAGTLVLVNNEKIENVYTRYRCTDDELIWLRQIDYKPATLEKEIIKYFYYTTEKGEKVKFIKLDSIGILEKYTPLLVQVLHGDRIGIYAWRHRNVISSTNQVDIMDKYIFKKDEEYHQIRLNKRNILGLFPEHKKQLRKIIRENRLKIRKEKDAARFVEILNNLDLK